MIAILACCVALAPARVVEMVKPKANGISIQALVTMPPLGAKDTAKLEILGRSIVKQTQAYPRREMLMVTNGAPVRFDMTPDHLRLVVNVPTGSLKAGLILMESLLRDASLTQESIDIATQEQVAPNYWTAAIDPILSPNVRLTNAFFGPSGFYWLLVAIFLPGMPSPFGRVIWRLGRLRRSHGATLTIQQPSIERLTPG